VSASLRCLRGERGLCWDSVRGAGGCRRRRDAFCLQEWLDAAESGAERPPWCQRSLPVPCVPAPFPPCGHPAVWGRGRWANPNLLPITHPLGRVFVSSGVFRVAETSALRSVRPVGVFHQLTGHPWEALALHVHFSWPGPSVAKSVGWQVKGGGGVAVSSKIWALVSSI